MEAKLIHPTLKSIKEIGNSLVTTRNNFLHIWIQTYTDHSGCLWGLHHWGGGATMWVLTKTQEPCLVLNHSILFAQPREKLVLMLITSWIWADSHAHTQGFVGILKWWCTVVWSNELDRFVFRKFPVLKFDRGMRLRSDVIELSCEVYLQYRQRWYCTTYISW